VTVVVLYFAALRDAVGTGSETLTLPDPVRTVGDLLQFLESRPALQGKLASVRVAIDESFVEVCSPLHDAATVALIPPVQGG
jgi:molybdopterin converting factor subunit 1